MVNVDEAVIARLKRDGEEFEILVDCDKALDFREGKCALEDALVTEDIFKDVKQGDKASENEMEKIFNTKDTKRIAEEIIKNGEIQLTTEHKNKIREEKRKKIVEIIHKNSVNPKTGTPHPAQRIELAMEEAKVKINEFKKAEEQVQEILSKIKEILPIKFEIWEIVARIPSKYAAQSFNILKTYGKMTKDEWQNDGSLVAIIDLPAGMSEKFENELNKLTKGEAEIKILNKK